MAWPNFPIGGNQQTGFLGRMGGTGGLFSWMNNPAPPLPATQPAGAAQVPTPAAGASGTAAPAASPAPVAPPPAAPAPAQTQGGGGLPQGLPPGLPPAMQQFWNMMTPEMQAALWQQYGQAAGGPPGQPPAGPAFDYPWASDNRAAAANRLLGFFGLDTENPNATIPFYGQDYFGLPGRSTAGEQMSQLIANLLYGQMGTQGERSAEAEALIRQLAAQGQTAAPWTLMNDALMRSQEMVQPGALDDYRGRLESEARIRAGESAQTSLQRLRDMGVTGTGAAGVDPAIAATALANRGLSQDLLGIDQMISEEEKRRLGLAGQLGAQGANVHGQMVAGPQAELANLLRMQQNPAFAQLIDYLNQQAQTAVQGDVAFRAQPNDFTRIGVPIISGALSALGGAAGGLLSNPNLFKG